MRQYFLSAFELSFLPVITVLDTYCKKLSRWEFPECCGWDYEQATAQQNTLLYNRNQDNYRCAGGCCSIYKDYQLVAGSSEIDLLLCRCINQMLPGLKSTGYYLYLMWRNSVLQAQLLFPCSSSGVFSINQ